MPKNTSVTLSDHFESFVASEVASGRFGNTSEVVRAGLRLLEHEEKTLQALRAAIDEGMNSGEPVDGAEAFARIRAKHGLEKPGA
jgi:antitoxin ParD1/3/4